MATQDGRVVGAAVARSRHFVQDYPATGESVAVGSCLITGKLGNKKCGRWVAALSVSRTKVILQGVQGLHLMAVFRCAEWIRSGGCILPSKYHGGLIIQSGLPFALAIVSVQFALAQRKPDDWLRPSVQPPQLQQQRGRRRMDHIEPVTTNKMVYKSPTRSPAPTGFSTLHNDIDVRLNQRKQQPTFQSRLAFTPAPWHLASKLFSLRPRSVTELYPQEWA